MKIASKSFTETGLSTYRAVVEQGGKLHHQVIRVINFVSEKVQDPRIAGPGVVAANIAFIELAILATRCVSYTLDYFFEPYENLNEEPGWQRGRAAILMGITTLSLIGANTLFYKGLKIPFSPLIMTAISVSSCIGYLLVKTNFLRDY